jgi:hypothetical protein
MPNFKLVLTSFRNCMIDPQETTETATSTTKERVIKVRGIKWIEFGMAGSLFYAILQMLRQPYK